MLLQLECTGPEEAISNRSCALLLSVESMTALLVNAGSAMSFKILHRSARSGNQSALHNRSGICSYVGAAALCSPKKLRNPVFSFAFAADQNGSLPPSPTLQHTRRTDGEAQMMIVWLQFNPQ